MSHFRILGNPGCALLSACSSNNALGLQLHLMLHGKPLGYALLMVLLKVVRKLVLLLQINQVSWYCIKFHCPWIVLWYICVIEVNGIVFHSCPLTQLLTYRFEACGSSLFLASESYTTWLSLGIVVITRMKFHILICRKLSTPHFCCAHCRFPVLWTTQKITRGYLPLMA
jgi:hypothetical protein